MATETDWLGWLSNGPVSLIQFEPNTATRRPAGKAIKFPSVVLPLRKWDGKIGPWKTHFGKGGRQTYPLTGRLPCPSCIEIEVVKVLRRHFDRAFWISTYNRPMPVHWRPYTLAFDHLPLWLADVDTEIRKKIHSKRGGIPDVVAWNLDSPQLTAKFVECKGRQESIRATQEDWVRTAIHEHFTPAQFAVAIRPF